MDSFQRHIQWEEKEKLYNYVSNMILVYVFKSFHIKYLNIQERDWRIPNWLERLEELKGIFLKTSLRKTKTNNIIRKAVCSQKALSWPKQYLPDYSNIHTFQPLDSNQQSTEVIIASEQTVSVGLDGIKVLTVEG